ncbi:hypothetical protein [Pandoraea morbifera]|uniref:hypothetical protein n=1 Tax=Pandoraea morbifera TaxID=2508300 RepID=UPI001583641D|nr:hypothetical protein [Pandoraea morbifera]
MTVPTGDAAALQALRFVSAIPLLRLARRAETIAGTAATAMRTIVGKIYGTAGQQHRAGKKQKSEFAH